MMGLGLDEVFRHAAQKAPLAEINVLHFAQSGRYFASQY
ncbi:hypothetical protein DSM3645_12251 [Blastopirellula marina DSM 3645]|uniref:Uncharacterized protein n=1 Tax=Blastopirellula marina DSM 3645 TaxID=314230 RepID=A3ZRM0_9BACT|nr:hypothetical protein DSM3645_12251 [Blastopirellula marina DSM 3645]